MTFGLRLSDVCSARVHPVTPADVFVGITATIALEVDGRVFWVEADVPVVELAAELNAWASTGLAEGFDFELDSMSTPEVGWFWIRRQGDGWAVGALHQESAVQELFTSDAIGTMIAELGERVTATVARALGVDVAEWIAS